MLIGIGENLGLKPAEKYEFRVFVSPVGPYYKNSGMAVIKLAVSEFDRAAPNGTGKYKAGANYAGGLLATLNAQGLGANEALYLDSAQNRYIDEAGSANIVIFTILSPIFGYNIGNSDYTNDAIKHNQKFEKKVDFETLYNQRFN